MNVSSEVCTSINDFTDAHFGRIWNAPLCLQQKQFHSLHLILSFLLRKIKWKRISLAVSLTLAIQSSQVSKSWNYIQTETRITCRSLGIHEYLINSYVFSNTYSTKKMSIRDDQSFY